MSEQDNGSRHRQSAGTKQEQKQEHKEVNLQFLDDTWERLLNAVERLEQVTEGFKSLSATRLDRHVDRDHVTEPELDVRVEVHLQIKSLQRIIHGVREDGQWMLGDFVRWFGGREGRPWAVTDDYAVPILHCVLGEPYQLPPLPEVKPTERDILGATEALSQGLHESDKVEEKFTADPAKEASRHTHERARSLEPGLTRLGRINPPLAERTAKVIHQQKEDQHDA